MSDKFDDGVGLEVSRLPTMGELPKTNQNRTI